MQLRAEGEGTVSASQGRGGSVFAVLGDIERAVQRRLPDGLKVDRTGLPGLTASTAVARVHRAHGPPLSLFLVRTALGTRRLLGSLSAICRKNRRMLPGMEWLNYHHLLYFWVVARHGSIVRASEELRLAHPTISGQIHRLEEVLGEKLFTRKGRSLVLTDA